MNRKLKYSLLIVIIAVTGPLGFIMLAVAMYQDRKHDRAVAATTTTTTQAV